MKSKILTLLAIGLLMTVSACAEAEQSEIGDKNTTLSLGEQVSRAKRNLAARLNVDASTIIEEAVRAVHWRSGARGCPNPEMSYTMAIQPGLLILLQVDGELYRYHSGKDGVPFYCPADRAEAPAMGQGVEAM